MNPNLQNKKNIDDGKSRISLDYFIDRIFRRLKKTPALQMKQRDENEILMEDIRLARQEWIDANLHFEYVNEDGLIDYHTYQIMACQARYEYFLKKAKKNGLKIIHREIESKIQP